MVSFVIILTCHDYLWCLFHVHEQFQLLPLPHSAYASSGRYAPLPPSIRPPSMYVLMRFHLVKKRTMYFAVRSPVHPNMHMLRSLYADRPHTCRPPVCLQVSFTTAHMQFAQYFISSEYVAHQKPYSSHIQPHIGFWIPLRNNMMHSLLAHDGAYGNNLRPLRYYDRYRNRHDLFVTYIKTILWILWIQHYRQRNRVPFDYTWSRPISINRLYKSLAHIKTYMRRKSLLSGPAYWPTYRLYRPTFRCIHYTGCLRTTRSIRFYCFINKVRIILTAATFWEHIYTLNTV